MANPPTPSDLIAQRVRDLRQERGWTVAELAARCKRAGLPRLTAQALYKLEAQRERSDRAPRPVTVDELLVLAYVLDIAPMYLIIGLDDGGQFPATPNGSVHVTVASNWIMGLQVLPGGDEKRYVGNLPTRARGAYAPTIDEQLAALDTLREDILRQREMYEHMTAIRQQALRMPLPDPADEGTE